MNDDKIDISERQFVNMLEELDKESKRYRPLQIAVLVFIFCIMVGGTILEQTFFYEIQWALRLLLVAVIAGAVTISIVFITNYPRRKRVELTAKVFPPFWANPTAEQLGKARGLREEVNQAYAEMLERRKSE